jgi:hypothetical protein
MNCCCYTLVLILSGVIALVDAGADKAELAMQHSSDTERYARFLPNEKRIYSQFGERGRAPVLDTIH